MAVVTQIQVRRGTAAQWTSANPTLASGEWGYETDTGKVKIGNGSTAWSSLSYFGGSGTVTSVTAGTGLTGGTITTTGTVAIDTSVVADLTTAQTLTNKTLTAPVINLSLNAQTGTTYTFVLADNGKLVTASNASAQTYTIPLNSSVAYATGAQINIIQIGAGQVTIQGTGGVTVASTGATATAPKLRAQYSSATLIKVATDTWYVVGDIA
jgi:hypothetical protein